MLDWWRGYLCALQDVQNSTVYSISKDIARIEKLIEEEELIREEEAKNVAISSNVSGGR